MNTFSRDKESEEATMEQRIPSLPKRLGVENYEHYVSNKGIMRCRSSAMKFGVSTLQHRPVVPTRVKSSSQFGQNMQMSNSSRQPLFMQQDRMRVSESSMLQKVEETRKKLTEGYQNAEDAKKRHAIQVIHANDSYANQQHKRFRLHDARKN
uniref:Uncharacterized protein n=2 Tax=Opuntia streptacantha TaxID=393608 RepID=A0A7C9EVS5_OPUST